MPFPMRGEPRLGPVHQALTAALAGAGIETARLDSRLLVQQALDISHSDFIKAPDKLLSDAELARLAPLAERRLEREPISRIRGETEFWSLPFLLSNDTLDPRPDTETLVEAALRLVEPRRDEPLRILDLGTGSGCILLSMLSAMAKARGVGVDLSAGAVVTAGENAARLKLAGRAEFVVSDWFDNVAGRFDLIVANPPYIASGEIGNLAPEVAEHEPRLALDGGADGLAPYPVIFGEAVDYVQPGWGMVLEFGAGQHMLVRKALENSPLYGEVGSVKFHDDLAGVTRVISIRGKGAVKTGN